MMSLSAVVGSIYTTVDGAVTHSLSHGVWGAIVEPSRWGEYVPLEFFLGLVLIVGLVLLACGVLGVIHAVALRLTAARVEALATADAAAPPDVMSADLLHAFRASSRLGRLARAYVGALQFIRDDDGRETLSSLQPAAEVFTAEALSPSVSKMGSERLLGTIVVLGGVIILIELGIGLLRLRAQLADPAGTHDLSALLDPAMSGAIFALGCVLLTAVSVGIHRLILKLAHANLARLQAAVDALFYPGAGRADEPLFDEALPAVFHAREPALSMAPREVEAPADSELKIVALGRRVSLRRAFAFEADAEPSDPPVRLVAEAGQGATVGSASGDAPVEPLERSPAAAEEIVAAAADAPRATEPPSGAEEDVLNQQQTLAERLRRFSDNVPEQHQASELAALRQSTAELALLADATRESITQLAEVIEGLSKIVAALIEHAKTTAAVPASSPPPGPAPGVARELRELLRDVEDAQALPVTRSGRDG